METRYKYHPLRHRAYALDSVVSILFVVGQTVEVVGLFVVGRTVVAVGPFVGGKTVVVVGFVGQTVVAVVGLFVVG